MEPSWLITASLKVVATRNITLVFLLKMDKLGRAFSTYASGEQCIQNFGGDI